VLVDVFLGDPTDLYRYREYQTDFRLVIVVRHECRRVPKGQ